MQRGVRGMVDRGPFWRGKGLHEMTREEWEALCDGCARCCLEKVKDEETGKIRVISVACEYLDMTTCRCTVLRIPPRGRGQGPGVVAPPRFRPPQYSAPGRDIHQAQGRIGEIRTPG
jgi:hypothetical protein